MPFESTQSSRKYTALDQIALLYEKLDRFRIPLLIVGVALTAFLLLFAWPIAVYLIAVCGIAVGLYKAQPRIDQLESVSPVWQRVLVDLVTTLLNCCLYIGAGLLIVCMVLVVLSFCPSCGPIFILPLEDLLVHIKEFETKLDNLISLDQFFVLVLACLLVSSVWPNAKLLDHLATIKDWTSRGFLLVATITCFTFVAPQVVKEYVDLNTPEYVSLALRIQQAQRELAAAAIIQDSLSKQSDQSREDLGMFLSEISRLQAPDVVFREVARQLASEYQEILTEADHTDALQDQGEHSQDIASKTLTWKESRLERDRPTVRELEQLRPAAEKIFLLLNESLNAVRLIAGEWVGTLIDANLRGMSDFIPSLAKELSGILPDSLLASVRDEASAREWWKSLKRNANVSDDNLQWSFGPDTEDIIVKAANRENRVKWTSDMIQSLYNSLNRGPTSRALNNAGATGKPLSQPPKIRLRFHR